MNIMELGALGEFVGSIGVIATLVYLAVQIRQNSRQIGENVRSLKRSEMNETMRTYSALRGLVMSDESLADIIVRGREDYDSLSKTEQERARNYLMEMIWINYHIWSRVQEGIMDAGYWERGEQYGIRMLLGFPAAKTVWQSMKSFFDPAYVAEVEGPIQTPANA